MANTTQPQSTREGTVQPTSTILKAIEFTNISTSAMQIGNSPAIVPLTGNISRGAYVASVEMNNDAKQKYSMIVNF